jgi:hypothetical protein
MSYETEGGGMGVMPPIEGNPFELGRSRRIDRRGTVAGLRH